MKIIVKKDNPHGGKPIKMQMEVNGTPPNLVYVYRKEGIREDHSTYNTMGQISDGYHTFDELYKDRTALFAVICGLHKEVSFKSFRHSDGTMFDGMFIAGVKTPEGYFTYHCELEYLWMFALTPEVEFAPKWDGHTSEDITRLFKLDGKKTL